MSVVYIQDLCRLPTKHKLMTSFMALVPGDIVGLYESEGCSQPNQLCSGVVTRVTQASITVAFDEAHDGLNLESDGPYNIMKLANDVTYKRLTR